MCMCLNDNDIISAISVSLYVFNFSKINIIMIFYTTQRGRIQYISCKPTFLCVLKHLFFLIYLCSVCDLNAKNIKNKEHIGSIKL